MSSTLVLTEAIIDDTDLCLTKIKDFNSTQELVSDQSVSDSNDSNHEMVLPFDENISEELELMKSFGLPIGFTSRTLNQRSNNWKKKKKKNRHKNNFKSMSEEFYSQNKDIHEIQENKGRVDWQLLELIDWSVNSCDTSVDNLNEKSKNGNYFENNFQFLPQMLTNCNLNEEYSHSVDNNDDNKCCDKQTNGDNNSVQTENTTTGQSLPTFSGYSSINSFVRNDCNGSDSDEPPEERPTHIKREHETDSIDFNEDYEQNVVKPKEKEVLSSRKKRKSKYFYQRYRLFSRFDDGIQLDNESWYSVTPERIAQHIANRFSVNNPFIIIDAFCGAGGNTIQFASITPYIKVIAIDIDERKISFAKHNASIYGVDQRIEFIVADYMLLAKTGLLKGDAVFLSPPWGGPKYLKEDKYALNMMTPIGTDVFKVTNTYISPNIGFLLPRNIDTNELTELAGNGNRVEVEHNLLNHKVKTVTAYFGNLIQSNTN